MSTLLKHFYDLSAEKDLISDEWTLLSVRREMLRYFLFFAFVLITLIVIAETLPPVPDGIMQAVILSTAATVGWYYFAHTLRHVHRHLWSARVLFYLMTTLLTPSICPHMLPDAS